ncbi:lysophospholipase [Mesorhizobium sp. B2-8-9]|uniref:esterase/lipase family protein n=1 Tax=Mesorhizobium sp. B2-8-9 TaxID=2589899 RepID=UPI00112A932D|nr:lysophospholipase [Mesorhizobium sp. B2-8-9]TPI78487.1 alpha/beta hydrolase [Mesorhizobium sp. B2-8-9]
MSTHAKIILVHGTWGRGFDPDKDAGRKGRAEPVNPRWFEPGSRFYDALSFSFSAKQTADLSAFLWSGANSIDERWSAAARLAQTLDKSVAENPETPHFVIAHSHGGNVALDARRSMQRNASNVHIITMATPFLSFYRSPPSFLDQIFVFFLSFSLIVLLCTKWVPWAISAPISVSLLSLLPALAFIIARTGDFSILRNPEGKLHLVRAAAIASIFVIFSVAYIEISSDGKAIFVALFTVMLLYRLLPVIGKFLYGNRCHISLNREIVPNLTILRSSRDEASLALFFGKMSSLLARTAGSIALGVPILAVVAAILLASFVLFETASEYRHYLDCISKGMICFVPGEYFLALIFGAVLISSKAFGYLAIGFIICSFLISMAAASKSFFGRELLYGSLNTIVDASDTPDGPKFYKVNRFAHPEDSGATLRHFLYNNPNVVNAIVTHISRVCAGGVNSQAMPAVSGAYQGSRNSIWQTAAAFAVTSSVYTILVMVAYAPSGAASSWCAVRAHFEQPGPKGGFTILVAGLENDAEGVGERIAKAVREQSGFHVIRTCLQVTANSEDGSSVERLLSDYNSDLVIGGRVATAEAIHLQIGQRGQQLTSGGWIVLVPTAISEFVPKQLQDYILHAVEDSAREVSGSEPPASILSYADQLDVFMQRIDWSEKGLERDKIEMYSASGRVLLAAALSSNNGPKAKRSIDYFLKASTLLSTYRDSAVKNDWSDEYNLSLFTDARLNKSETSAKSAFALYLNKYKDAVEAKYVSNYDLYVLSSAAASAASVLYSITLDREAANSTNRLACESLLRLRYWQEDRKAIEKRDKALTEKGLSQGLLPEAPPPERSEGYKLLLGSGKDPNAIFAQGKEMKPEDCKEF